MPAPRENLQEKNLLGRVASDFSSGALAHTRQPDSFLQGARSLDPVFNKRMFNEK
jgi:hypothetical protein